MDTGISSGTGPCDEETKNLKFEAPNAELESFWKKVRPYRTATFYKHGFCLLGEDKRELGNTVP